MFFCPHLNVYLSACLCLSACLSVSLSPVLLEVLQDLMESSQANAGPGSPASSGQVRVARLDESTGGGSGGDVGGANDDSVTSLQIPVQIPLQITHLGESVVRACFCLKQFKIRLLPSSFHRYGMCFCELVHNIDH